MKNKGIHFYYDVLFELVGERLCALNSEEKIAAITALKQLTETITENARNARNRAVNNEHNS